MQRNFIEQCGVIAHLGVGQNAHIRSLTVILKIKNFYVEVPNFNWQVVGEHFYFLSMLFQKKKSS